MNIYTGLAAVVTFFSGVLAWYLNERGKRNRNEYKSKEKRYALLLESLEGFYVESHSTEKIRSFLKQLNLCWLYCPDEVIQKANSFLCTVHRDQPTSDQEKERALGEFVLAIRKDLLGKKATCLVPGDFKIFGVNRTIN